MRHGNLRVLKKRSLCFRLVILLRLLSKHDITVLNDTRPHLISHTVIIEATT